MSYAVSMLRKGRTWEMECPRTTHRLQAAWAILGTMGIEPTIIHADTPSNEVVEWGRVKHGCDWKCKAAPLPEWVTDEILQMAYTLADRMISERGAANRADAYRAKAERGL